MTTMSANGRGERKSLAGQLDRMDCILDGLSDGLNEAVAQAVRDVVSVAVEAAVREVLTSAELLRRLRPEPAVRPGKIRWAASVLCSGVVSVAKRCWTWAVALTGRARERATAAVTVVRAGQEALVMRGRRGLTPFVRRVWRGGCLVVRLTRRFRVALAVSLAAGAALAAAGYLAGPAVSSLVNGLAGFVAALAASALGGLRGVVRGRGLRASSVRRITW